MIIQELYEDVADVMLEPGGFQSGLVTEDQFLGYYRSVMEDFLGRTRLIQAIGLVAQQFGMPDYIVPDWLSDIENGFSDGNAIFFDFENSISGRDLRWQSRVATVRSWFQDKQNRRTMSLFPCPVVSRNAQTMDPGIITAWVPGGDLTQIQAFIGTMSQGNQLAQFSSPGLFFDVAPPNNVTRGNFAMLGKQGLLSDSVELDDLIESLTDDFIIYIKYGILQKIFAVDGENRDPLRERYCAARYEEGVMLGKAMMAEEVDTE